MRIGKLDQTRKLGVREKNQYTGNKEPNQLHFEYQCIKAMISVFFVTVEGIANFDLSRIL